MPAPKTVTIYCASASGFDARFAEAARALGAALAGRGVAIAYGGAHVGLMGMTADAAREAGGRVIGVIPERLVEREVAHENLTELVVVDTMHERKRQMADLGDAFVAMPGGLGTLDELFEIATWSQLGMHTKPIVLLNVAGYFDHLIAFLNHAEESGLLQARNRAIIQQVADVPALLSLLFG
ncbi:MAG: TIGR00730 family Rossman fold protein [Deltaproteobacteria bacterium]|nr:TIGR00730 family Rossman fold protein [Deltaproteobacteria bacterium]